ncbi:hypothetical protein SAMN04487891_101565 [Flagellimonas taeanensis]|uniref:ABC-2 type transport system permease protein n=1 Tax=Flagellimonas taeanensis TaxID=1005926 RepID=A0A1M6QEV1_9FLAO|nr:DUF5687 family protein [Allomuricauda taeanensis]SFB70540.1 hypothetical protein SAMN04487891_101565 [Allomuricauda taeanensis]SHK18799.1 hypothetical protein SAMN05216293_0572 [Allomuricauda taeanensis]
MFKHFLGLQWKSFYRSASFKTEIWFKILMALGALWFIGWFLLMGYGIYFFLEDAGLGDPLRVVNRFMVYYLTFDLVFRYMLQKMPVTNIKPLLYLPFKKSQVVNFSLGKTVVSFFNWSHAFFFVPFSVVLLTKGYPFAQVVGWHLAMMAIIYCNNFINVMVNNKDAVFYVFAGLVILAGISQFYQWFDITLYAQPIFDYFYDMPWTAIVPWALLLVLYFSAFGYFKKHMYLDGGLAKKHTEVRTENLDWLNRFGNLGTFLKNDIKLIKRNKRSRTAVLTGFFFIFYGLLFFTGAIEAYDGPFWKIFAGIFVTGGFLFSFGQYVPSWDSSYYPLMMSQNIKYREYLSSKWYLIIIATVISTILATFYVYFGWEAYAAVLVGAIYNIGINSYLVLWGGAYVKTPIELTSNKKAFGDKQAFNAKTLLLTLPKLLLPMVIYAIGHFLISPLAGYLFVAAFGLMGFVFKERAFKMIEGIYKKEKYKTLLAYKQK